MPATTTMACQISWYPNTRGRGSGQRRASTSAPSPYTAPPRRQQHVHPHRESGDELGHGDEGDPGHGCVEERPEPVAGVGPGHLDRNADRRCEPHADEQRPPPRPVQHEQADGGERPGDEDVDGGVVDLAQPPLGRRGAAEPVVGAARPVERGEADGVDDGAGQGETGSGAEDECDAGRDRRHEGGDVDASPQDRLHQPVDVGGEPCRGRPFRSDGCCARASWRQGR